VGLDHDHVWGVLGIVANKPEAELVAIADPHPELVEKAKAIAPVGVKFFSENTSMLDDESPEAVNVTAANRHHLETPRAVRLLGGSVKGELCRHRSFSVSPLCASPALGEGPEDEKSRRPREAGLRYATLRRERRPCYYLAMERGAVMISEIRWVRNPREIIIPEPMLKEAGLEKDAEIGLERGAIVLRKARRTPRQGWAEASRGIAEAGDDKLIWPEFANPDDGDLETYLPDGVAHLTTGSRRRERRLPANAASASQRRP
jgi:antitoxin MazE